MWPPDAYEAQEDADSNGYVELPFNSHQDRNFHVPGDVDQLISAGWAMPGEMIRVRLVPLGAHAAPLMDVELYIATPAGDLRTPLGSGITGELQYMLQEHEMGNVRVRIRNAGGAAGMGTDYRVHLERQSVFPRVGPWYNPARSGHGIDFQRTSDGKYVAGWYTYRADGSPTWYVSDVAPIEGTRWRSPLYATTWDGSTSTRETVGTLEMSFSGEENATFSWSFPGTGVQGSEPFVFYTFATGGTGVANGIW